MLIHFNICSSVTYNHATDVEVLLVMTYDSHLLDLVKIVTQFSYITHIVIFINFYFVIVYLSNIIGFYQYVYWFFM